jgi:hypothetical protein
MIYISPIQDDTRHLPIVEINITTNPITIGNVDPILLFKSNYWTSITNISVNLPADNETNKEICQKL